MKDNTFKRDYGLHKNEVGLNDFSTYKFVV